MLMKNDIWIYVLQSCIQQFFSGGQLFSQTILTSGQLWAIVTTTKYLWVINLETLGNYHQLKKSVGDKLLISGKLPPPGYATDVHTFILISNY